MSSGFPSLSGPGGMVPSADTPVQSGFQATLNSAAMYALLPSTAGPIKVTADPAGYDLHLPGEAEPMRIERAALAMGDLSGPERAALTQINQALNEAYAARSTPIVASAVAPDIVSTSAIARGSAPVQSLSFQDDREAAQQNFAAIVRHGTGLGDAAPMEASGSGHSTYFSANSYGAKRILDAWDTLTGQPLPATTNGDRVRALQTKLNELRQADGKPALQVDGLLGPATVWAMHQAMEATLQDIVSRAHTVNAQPAGADRQAKVESLKVELTNATSLNRAVTPLGAAQPAYQEGMDVLNPLDARMPPTSR